MKYPIKKVGIKNIDWVSVILETDLPAHAKMIAMYLSRFMNKDQDMAWPSLSRITKELSTSKSTVCKYIDLLEAEGWLLRERGGPNTNTKYIIGFPTVLEQALIELGSPSDGLGVVRHTDKGSTPHALGVVRETDTNNPLNNPLNNKEASPVNVPTVSRQYPDTSDYPEWLDMEAWSDWKQHRKEIRKPMTPLAEEKAIKRLQSMLNGISQRQIIDHCIANGYQGLFPPQKQTAKETGDIYARA